ncbi:MAG: hypothetical protein IJ387_03920, partial [Thermoguttaceae bacterium]|nr:hypothetical protein [Thermoguttaceae bacterium]
MIENCAILANEAIYGGGIYSYWSGSGGATPRTFLNCVVSDNTASYGGGVYSRYDEDTLTFINCAITDNEALNGGGVYLYCSEETTTFTNCVIAGNIATYYGSGVYLRESEATLFNSIVALNQGNAEVGSSESAVKAYCTLSSYSEWNGGSDNYVFNPSQPLFKDAANGDYTLATNSQALDKGNDAYVVGYLTDLAGKPRVFGSNVDLGAYELIASETSPLVVTTNSDVVDETDGKISLREAILYAESNATLDDTITFASSMKGKTITLTNGELKISQGVKIDASSLYAASTGTPGITVDANKLSRAFYISGGSEENPVELVGLTITGGRTEENGGGICLASGVANFQKCAIIANTAIYGGGLYVGSGGGVALDCVISRNDADYGGAAYIASGFEYSLEFINCLAVENEATNYGGAFYLDGSAAMFKQVTIARNAARSGGGCYLFENGMSASLISVYNSILAENIATLQGVDLVRCGYSAALAYNVLSSVV